MKPDVRLYDTFSNWVENSKNQATDADVQQVQQTQKRNWYRPPENTEASCQDVEDIAKMFPRDDCQEAYTEYLRGERIPIDATAIKYQNGIVAADEQAYRIRHASIPRSLAAGYLELLRWNRGTLPMLLTKRVQVWDNLANEDYTVKND